MQKKWDAFPNFKQTLNGKICDICDMCEDDYYFVEKGNCIGFILMAIICQVQPMN